MGGVLRRPPVCELAFGIKFRARIIKAMANLVPDGGADRAIVGGSVRLRIEERRFQNGSGEVESVLQREIQGVDRLRCHPPFVAVDGFTQLAISFSSAMIRSARPAGSLMPASFIMSAM